MTTKKKTKKSSEKKSETHKTKKINTNYWVISTFVLAAVLVVTLIGSDMSTATISSKAAGQEILDLLAMQGTSAELISVEDQGSLYQVVVSVDGQEAPVQITKDGKSIVMQSIKVEELRQQSSPTATGAAVQDAPSVEVSTKLDKPIVELFVMSHCPYGTQVEKGILPVLGLLGDKIDAEIKFVYYSMHPSSGEVEEQLNQYCIQRDQNDKYYSYLTCFLEAGDGESCLASTEIDTDVLETCTTATDAKYDVLANLEDTSSWLSGSYPLFNIYLEDNQKYGVGGSPTLVINGETVSAGRDSDSLLAAICSGFNNAPEECNTVFNSATPGPGFGWSTTGAANTAAYCG